MLKDHFLKFIGLFIMIVVGPLIIYLTDYFLVAVGIGIIGIMFFLIGLNIKQPKEMNC